MLTTDDQARFAEDIKALTDVEVTLLNGLFHSRAPAWRKLAALRPLASSQAEGRRSAWANWSTSLPRRGLPTACRELAVLIQAEAEARSRRVWQAEQERRRRILPEDVAALTDGGLALMLDILTVELDSAQARRRFLARLSGHPVGDLIGSAWRKWANLPEGRDEEIVAEIRTLLEAEKARRFEEGRPALFSKHQTEADQDTEP